MMTNVVKKKNFRFDEGDLEAVVNAKLTTNELNLWLYLCLLDPFGDRPVELPPFEVIKQKLNISKSSYYSALKKDTENNFLTMTTSVLVNKEV